MVSVGDCFRDENVVGAGDNGDTGYESECED